MYGRYCNFLADKTFLEKYRPKFQWAVVPNPTGCWSYYNNEEGYNSYGSQNLGLLREMERKIYLKETPYT